MLFITGWIAHMCCTVCGVGGLASRSPKQWRDVCASWVDCVCVDWVGSGQLLLVELVCHMVWCVSTNCIVGYWGKGSKSVHLQICACCRFLFFFVIVQVRMVNNGFGSSLNFNVMRWVHQDCCHCPWVGAKDCIVFACLFQKEGFLYAPTLNQQFTIHTDLVIL